MSRWKAALQISSIVSQLARAAGFRGTMGVKVRTRPDVCEADKACRRLYCDGLFGQCDELMLGKIKPPVPQGNVTTPQSLDKMATVTSPAQAPTILALETSSEFCSVALQVGGQQWSRDSQAVQKHSELLLPMVHELLMIAALKVCDVDAIAFGAGPGSFTGLRIACGVVQGLAFPTGRKVVPVGSLEALAESTDGQRVVVCTDARMGQIYHGAFERDGLDWRTVLPPSLCDPARAPNLPGPDWIGCGNGFERYGALLNQQYGEQLSDVKEEVIPQAEEIASLGVRYFLAGLSVPCTQALPLYVRNKVALTMKEQK